MSFISVADLLAYDALPDDVRAICDKKREHERGDVDDLEESSYDLGYEAGEAQARTELEAGNARIARDLERAMERVSQLEDFIINAGLRVPGRAA